MSTHTPGPWKVDVRFDNCYGVKAEAGTVTIHNHGTQSISDYVAQPAHGNPHPIGSQAHANMQLTAAAPEMKEMIRWVAQTVHQAHHTEQSGTFQECPKNTCVEATKIIAKAEGRSDDA